jgi:hypothetical protein
MRSGSTGSFSEIFSGNATSHNASPLTAGSYGFRVSATNSAGTSAFSEISNFATAGFFAPNILTGEFPSSRTLLNGNYRLYWRIDNNTELVVGIQTQGTGWAGFGLGSNMNGADIMVGSVASNTPTVNDYWAVGTVTPILDTNRGGTNGILEFNGEEVGGVTTIKFRRNLVSDDTNDIDITPGSRSIIFAYHRTSDTLTQHGSGDRGTTSVNLFDVGNVNYFLQI